MVRPFARVFLSIPKEVLELPFEETSGSGPGYLVIIARFLTSHIKPGTVNLDLVQNTLGQVITNLHGSKFHKIAFEYVNIHRHGRTVGGIIAVYWFGAYFLPASPAFCQASVNTSVELFRNACRANLRLYHNI